MKNSLMIRATCICSVVFATSTASADRRFVDYGWRVSSKGAERLAADLGIQGESVSRTVFESLWQEYNESLETRANAWEDETKQLRLSLIFEIAGPELDEAFDISDLPAEEQDRIENMRAMFKRDRNPFLNDRRFVEPWAAHSKRLGRIVNAYEAARRDEFVTACHDLVTGEDREAIAARSRRRLAINIHALLPFKTTLSRAGEMDPVWRVDMLKLLEDATDSGAELEWARTIVIDPQAAIAEHEGALAKFAKLLSAFEVEFATLVESYEKGLPEWGTTYGRLMWDDREGAARILMKRDNGSRNEILLRRRQFAEDVGALLGEMNAEWASNWINRYRLLDCPRLFSDDSVDLVVRALLTLTDLPEDERDAVEAVYDLYTSEREPLRASAYDLELREYCDQRIPLKSEPESRWTKQLHQVSQRRVTLAERTVRRLRGTVDPSRSPMVDQVVAAYRERVKRSVEVRP